MEAYKRQVGLFGSVTQLGKTVISGANDITQGTVTTAVQTVNIAVTISAVADKGVSTWGQTVLRQIESNAIITDMELQIEEAQMLAELNGLKAKLAEISKPGRPVGRPSKAK